MGDESNKCDVARQTQHASLFVSGMVNGNNKRVSDIQRRSDAKLFQKYFTLFHCVSSEISRDLRHNARAFNLRIGFRFTSLLLYIQHQNSNFPPNDGGHLLETYINLIRLA